MICRPKSRNAGNQTLGSIDALMKAGDLWITKQVAKHDPEPAFAVWVLGPWAEEAKKRCKQPNTPIVIMAISLDFPLRAHGPEYAWGVQVEHVKNICYRGASICKRNVAPDHPHLYLLQYVYTSSTSLWRSQFVGICPWTAGCLPSVLTMGTSWFYPLGTFWSWRTVPTTSNCRWIDAEFSWGYNWGQKTT